MALTKSTFGKQLPGWFAGPESGRPGVVVLQEWWGITEEVKKQAERIATSLNYRVLVPDLYKGKLGVDKEEAHHLMSNLDWPQAVEELKQAVQHLRSEGCTKVGAVGFCMGGALALLAAEHAGVDAAVSFYGTPDPALGHPEKVQVPVQLHSGTLDSFKGFADPPTVSAWAEKVPGQKEVYIYENEGHAFMNEGEGAMAGQMASAGIPKGSPEARALGWERVQAFFRQHLG